ncbi:MAG: MBL fold metallo-hydrolase [Desulfitobacteriaceae bacterium]|nr:MBL fold metallo-hydrolase [Desulfitobacteriaceae bacterium]
MIMNEYQGVRIFNRPVKMLGTALTVYVYLVDGMLVDSGPYRLQQNVGAFCSRWGIDKIVHTHFHEDHTGNTAYLIQHFHIPAYAHPSSLERLQHNGNIPFYRLAYWGKRPGFKADPLPDLIENHSSRFHVIPTPGHTSDHVVFLDKEHGRLFSGDLFVHPKTRIVMSTENIPQIMESLRRILQENFETVYCAHAGVIKNGYRLVEQKLANLEALQDQIFTLQEKGLSHKTINRKLFPETPPITYYSFGEWSSYHLVHSLAENLKKT